MAKSISSPDAPNPLAVNLFDVMRMANPDLGFAVYAYTPGGPVTLEVHAATGIYPFEGATLADTIALAFPDESAPEPEPATDIFD